MLIKGHRSPLMILDCVSSDTSAQADFCMQITAAIEIHEYRHESTFGMPTMC